MNNPWMSFKVTQHASRVIREKQFNSHDIIHALAHPDEVYESRNHVGQWRITGRGLCIVGKPEGDTFIIITVYLDRVITPLRPDQIANGVTINRSN